MISHFLKEVLEICATNSGTGIIEIMSDTIDLTSLTETTKAAAVSAKRRFDVTVRNSQGRLRFRTTQHYRTSRCGQGNTCKESHIPPEVLTYAEIYESHWESNYPQRSIRMQEVCSRNYLVGERR
jgi:hypothetical protein